MTNHDDKMIAEKPRAIEVDEMDCYIATKKRVVMVSNSHKVTASAEFIGRRAAEAGLLPDRLTELQQLAHAQATAERVAEINEFEQMLCDLNELRKGELAPTHTCQTLDEMYAYEAERNPGAEICEAPYNY